MLNSSRSRTGVWILIWAAVNILDGRAYLRWTLGSIQGGYYGSCSSPYVGSMSFGLTRNIDRSSCGADDVGPSEAFFENLRQSPGVLATIGERKLPATLRC